MNETDRSTLYSIVTMAMLLQERQATDVLLEAWFRFMEPYSIDEVREGVYAHLSDPRIGVYPIQPAHVIARITTSTEEDALEQWGIVEARIRGRVTTAVIDSRSLAVVEEMGGWRDLCPLEKDFQHRAAEFKKRFMAKRPLRIAPSRRLGNAKAIAK